MDNINIRSKRWRSSKYFNCDRCNTRCPAYYTLSLKTKGLFVQCPKCKTHAIQYIEDLDLPYRPSSHYQMTMEQTELFTK